MLVIRGTKKVLDRLGGVTAAEADRSTTQLGDWYVNIVFWKPQVALFVSEATLLPVLMPFAPASSLLDRFSSVLLTHLQAHEVPRSFTDQELSEMESRRLAKTASRSVLGVMNEFKYLAGVHSKVDDESDLLTLSMHLARTPCSPLYKRHVSPDRELAALVSATRD